MTQGDVPGIGEITGRITNSLGEGVGNLLIEAYPEGDSSGSALKEIAVTAADGTYNLAFTPGNFKLNITLSPYSYGSYLPAPSDPYVLPQWYQGKADFANANAVSISAGATNGGHDDQLADGAAISGMLTSSSGDPILETLIASFTPDGSPTGGYTRANTASYLVGHIRIPASGTVKARFTGIGGAGYFATWYAGKFSLAAADLITVSPRVTTPNIDIVLQSRNGAGSIKGRVTDGGGNGIPNVAVRAYDFAQGEVQYATTGSTGDYTISFVPPIEARVYFDASTSSYASRWYNSKDSFGAADPININSGTHITSIDAVLGAKTIQLLSPNGGEVWAVGSSQNITWTSSLGVGKVRIEVSTDTGASYTDIAAEAENTGTYPWRVPDTPSTSCLIRISAAGALIDVSDARFAIAAAGVPRRLAFVQQPTGTTVNGTINPPITVEILDVVGNRVLTATDTVLLSLRNGGSAILNGALSRSAVAGLASFGDLSVNVVGTGYLLRANSGSLTEVDSIPFNITAPVATKVQVETQANGSGVIVPAQSIGAGSSVTVYAIARTDSNGFVENAAVDSWSLVNRTGGVVNGDLVVSGDRRSATFTSHLAGSAQIRATLGGLTSVDSGTLTVIGVTGTKLVFYQQPGGGAGGQAWPQPAIVEVQDAGGNLVTSDNHSGVDLTIVDNPGGGTLSGTSHRTVFHGRAQFDNLSIDRRRVGIYTAGDEPRHDSGQFSAIQYRGIRLYRYCYERCKGESHGNASVG